MRASSCVHHAVVDISVSDISDLDSSYTPETIPPHGLLLLLFHEPKLTSIDCAAACPKSPQTSKAQRRAVHCCWQLYDGMDPDRVLSLARCLRRCRSTPDLSFTAVSLLSKVGVTRGKTTPATPPNTYHTCSPALEPATTTCFANGFRFGRSHICMHLSNPVELYTFCM